MTLRDIGRAVKDARRRASLTQNQLAVASGLSRLTIIQLENGTLSDLGVRKLERVLSVLDFELALRDASPLPTLDDLAAERSSAAHNGRRR